ncbi:MAG: hypothetical protein C5B47_07000 [Verrucomicrobia bacterium]|nr:MAG: hypothetical protein C5B47_07000 [Verrucomicrobiota bacterium]
MASQENLDYKSWRNSKSDWSESTPTNADSLADLNTTQKAISQKKTLIGDLTGEGASKTAVTKFGYNDKNLLTSVKDPLGNEVSAFYEESSNPRLPSRMEYKTQGKVVFDIRNTYYPADAQEKLRGLLKKQQIAAGTPNEATVEHTYNEQGLLVSQKKISGNGTPGSKLHSEKVIHGPGGEITTYIDPQGGETKYIYTRDGPLSLTMAIRLHSLMPKERNKFLPKMH